MNFFYDFGILIYRLGISISSLWNLKARQWIKGRKNLFQKIQSSLQPNETRIWFHCASVGEFEQGRPVIEGYRKRFPRHKIVLSFFSPSGFEQKKNYSGADYIFYLPIDTKVNAKKFLSLIQPKLAVFVKYEFWWNHLAELKRNAVETILISAVFREEQFFFRWFGKSFLELLKGFKMIFLQDENSFQLLKKYGIENAMVAGDTRFDRVWEIAQHPVELPVIKEFKGDKKLFVGGSTWEEDEEVLLKLIDDSSDEWKFVIVPHEINHSTLHVQHYSEIEKRKSFSSEKILLVDKTGLLSSIYQYADVAYIGGGFGKGIHNTLEAAVFGIPVLFGPRYQKFSEAKQLIANGGGRAVSNLDELKSAFDFFLQAENILHGESNRNFVEQKRGATEKILYYLESINSGSAASAE